MEKITSRDGTAIAYYRSGAGRPLLLVHGATADHTRWSPILPLFEPHFTVYAMDRRGRGGSGDSADYDIMREAEDVAAVVEAIGEPAFVLGHSYGGTCCLEAALLTDKVSRLILYEPDIPIPTGIPLMPAGARDRLDALIERGAFEAALEVVFREIVGMPEHEFETYRRQPVWKTRISLVPTIPRELSLYETYRFNAERFASLQTPTLLLAGGDSPPFAMQAAEEVDTALPDGRIVVLPGEGHIAMDTDPELFVSEVLRFLSG